MLWMRSGRTRERTRSGGWHAGSFAAASGNQNKTTA
jgi:hypothetical protein